MASTVFSNFARNLALGRHDFSTDTLRVLLVSSVPSEANIDGWLARPDITNEITGTGYTAGGITQLYTLNALDTAANRQSVTLSNVVNGWTSATFTAAGAIIYKLSGVGATDYLIEFVDFGANVACTNGNFSITYSSDLLISRV